MKKVLVTGAQGQLGMCIQKVVGDYKEIRFSFKDLDELNIAKQHEVEAIFAMGEFDFCINCAAYTNVEQAEKTPEPAYEANAKAVRFLAMACKTYATTLIHISTDYVFDGTKEGSYAPDDKTNPINEYGKSKLLGEEHIQEILTKYYIIRTSWLYSEFGNNFYKTILKKAKEEKQLRITDDQIGCPTNANNLARYVLDIIDRDGSLYGIHHFTDGEAMTWYDFAKNILKENGLEKSVDLQRAENYRSFAERPKNSILSLKK